MTKVISTRNLFRAIEDKNLQEMQRSLKQGADPSLLLIPEGISCLHLVAGINSKNALRMTVLLLLCGGNPNVRSLDGITPVHVAAAWGHKIILHILLKYGGDVNLRDSDGNNVMSVANEYDQKDIIDYLNNRRAAVSLVSKYKKTDGDFNLTSISADCKESVAMLSMQKRDKKVVQKINIKDEIEKECPYTEVLSLEDGISDQDACMCRNESLDMSQGTWYTVDEYLCVDDQEKLAFIEHKVKPLQNPTATQASSECSETTKSSIKSLESTFSSETFLKSLKDISDDDLLKQLRRYGDQPGPITELTRRVYLRRLHKLKKIPNSDSLRALTRFATQQPVYSDPLTSALNGRLDIDSLRLLNEKFLEIFDTNQAKCQWKGGVIKSSFNYLLIDPKISRDLPLRAQSLSSTECFTIFIKSIFYIGKGKNARPYDHLHEALEVYSNKVMRVTKKVQKILDIWNAGLGVVSLHCFHGSIEVEALTREACLIDAIGLTNVTNSRKGEYHAQVSKWSPKDKCKLGVLFLFYALQIFLYEGERQIQPFNIGSGLSSPIVKRNLEKKTTISTLKVSDADKR